jgi:tight adherence protein C
MPELIALATFFAVSLGFYGMLARSTTASTMEARLFGIRQTRPQASDPLPDPDAAFTTRVVKPFARGLARRAAAILPSTMATRIDASITQAGLRMTAGQFLVVTAATGGVLPIVIIAILASGGAPAKQLLLMGGICAGLGLYGPRIWLLGRVKRRQKEIWRSLPDAFDLITASVEAGLGIDAAFTRVIEKVTGPFAEELTRTMREITMGRSRREAFVDMAARTGVDELRSLVNAIVQAETMGISVGSVIRVQTGVIRTKRRQKAEELAFKAPIKMVFPLVFFIFPAIMAIIGGPAIIQLKNGF